MRIKEGKIRKRIKRSSSLTISFLLLLLLELAFNLLSLSDGLRINNTPIITCASSSELERAISIFCKPGDHCLEFGSQYSDVSKKLCETVIVPSTSSSSSSSQQQQQQQQQSARSSDPYYCGSAILVDIERRSDAKSGRCTHRNVDKFRSMPNVKLVDIASLEDDDDWKETIFGDNNKRRGPTTTTTTTKQEQTTTVTDTKKVPPPEPPNYYYYYFDVILLDLGHLIGNDLYLSTLYWTNEILKMSSSSSPQPQPSPRVILVKSKSLASLSRRLIPAQHVGMMLVDDDDNNNNKNHVGQQQQRRKVVDKDLSNNKNNNNNDKEPFIFCSVGVEEYRRLIPYTVQPGDAVIEVGCHFGRTTFLLDEAAKKKNNNNNKGNEQKEAEGDDDDDGYCIGVDIGPKIIQNAMSQYPKIQFAVADARKTLDLLRLRNKNRNNHKKTNKKRRRMNDNDTDDDDDDDDVLSFHHHGLLLRGYDVVFADIGGLSGAHGTLEALALLESLSNALEPRVIVMKSLCMKRLASQLKSFTHIWAKQQKKQKQQQKGAGEVDGTAGE